MKKNALYCNGVQPPFPDPFSKTFVGLINWTEKTLVDPYADRHNCRQSDKIARDKLKDLDNTKSTTPWRKKRSVNIANKHNSKLTIGCEL